MNFSNDFLEKIFADKEMQKIPVGCQSTAVSVFERILYELKEENPYTPIDDLFAESEQE